MSKPFTPQERTFWRDYYEAIAQTPHIARDNSLELIRAERFLRYEASLQAKGEQIEVWIIECRRAKLERNALRKLLQVIDDAVSNIKTAIKGATS